MNAEENLSEQLSFPGMDSTPSREDTIARRKSILRSHGNKTEEAISHIAENTSIPDEHLHLLAGTPIKAQKMRGSVLGGSRPAVTEAQKWSREIDELGLEDSATYRPRDPVPGSPTKRWGALPVADIKNLAKPEVMYDSRSGDGATAYTLAHEIGHDLSYQGQTRGLDEIYEFNRETGRYTSAIPALEGNAEGYAERYSTPVSNAGYTPGYFGRIGKDKYESSTGPALFSMAKEHTRTTGDMFSLKDHADIYGLTGVIKGDHVGGHAHRMEQAHKMAMNEIQRRSNDIHGITKDSEHYEEPIHESERRAREIAINGQWIQGSLMPDINPEVNQFGDAPIEVERSKEGWDKFEARDPWAAKRTREAEAARPKKKKAAAKKPASVPTAKKAAKPKKNDDGNPFTIRF